MWSILLRLAFTACFFVIAFTTLFVVLKGVTRHLSPTRSIVAVATVQILLGVLILAGLASAVHTPIRWDEITTLGVALFGSALLGIIAAVGLLRRKNWARLLSLCLVTAAVCAAATAAVLHKRRGFDFTREFLEALLWVMIPMGVWWWIILARPLGQAASSQSSMNLAPRTPPKWKIAVFSLALSCWLAIGVIGVYCFLNPF
jgi:hypothetical protein